MQILMRRLCVMGSLIGFVGCAQQESNSNAGVEVSPAVVNVAGAQLVQFSVPDMMCPEGCGEKVKEILAEQPGAKEVLVDFEAKTATVVIEDGKFDAKQAVAALVDHQFNHSAAIKSGIGNSP
jgi:copper chaperone CopZ